MRTLKFYALLTIILFSVNAQAQFGIFVSNGNQELVFSDGSAHICEGGDATLVAIGENPDESEIKWITPEGRIIEGSQMQLFNFDEAQEGIYEVQFSKIGEPFPEELYAVELSMLKDEFARFRIRDYVITAGETFKLYAPYRKDGTSYMWSNGSDAKRLVVEPRETTTYTLTTTSKYGCQDFDQITVYVAEKGQASSEERIICKRGRYYIEGPEGFETYNWLSTSENTKDIAIVTRQYRIIHLQATDNKGNMQYFEYILHKFDCREEMNKGSLVRTDKNQVYGLEEGEIEEELDLRSNHVISNSDLHSQEFQLYPNPSSAFVKVKLDNVELDQELIISVYDSNGILISELNNRGNDFMVNLNNYKSGTYIMQIYDGNITKAQQFVIAN